MNKLRQQSDRPAVGSAVAPRDSNRRQSVTALRIAAFRGLLVVGLLIGLAAPASLAREARDEPKENATDASPSRSADKSSDLEKTERTEKKESNTHKGPTTSSAISSTATSVAGGAHNLADPFPPATPQRVVDVTAKLFPAVVRLDVAQEVYTEGKRSMQRGIGSGVIFDKDGRILTNYHVAGRGVELFVTLFNKERVRAHLVGDDHWTDLAVIQLDADEVK